MSFIAVLNKLEKKFPVNSLRIDGMHIWPLVRLRINTRRKYALNKQSPLYALVSIAKAVCFYLASLVLVRKINAQRKRLDSQIAEILFQIGKLDKTDFLILCLEKEHYQKIEGKPFAPLLDSLISISGSEQRFMKVSLAWKGDVEPFYPTHNLNLSPFVSRSKIDSLNYPTSLRSLLQSILAAGWLGLLALYLKVLDSDYSIDIPDVMELIAKMRGQRVLFRKLLITVRPQAVLMTSYIGRIGLVSAARELRIPVFDIQHGGMYKDHALSANWNAIPEGGYHYLPDYFWCWNQTAGEIVENCSGSIVDLPKPFVGGHPWLGLCSSEHNNLLLTHDQNSFLANVFQDPRRTVLLALQYGAGSNLESFVVDLIKETSEKWKWLIRLHPMGKDMKQELTKELPNIQAIEEIDVVSEIPLHILLKEVDHVITGFSSIGTEAMNFGIRTTIFSPIGLKFFKLEIESGAYDYADNKESLKQSILNPCSLSAEQKMNISAIPTNKNHLISFMEIVKNSQSSAK